MEEIEKKGRCGQQAKGTEVTALDRVMGDLAVEGLGALGDKVGIRFDTEVQFEWYPEDSQRLLLWAAQRGKQEEIVGALAKRHFERRTSVTSNSTLVDAAADVGLDREETEAFLRSSEFRREVRQSYAETVRMSHKDSEVWLARPTRIFRRPTRMKNESILRRSY